jgi:hypothetical protein
MNLTHYHARYFAHELTKRSSSDNLDKLASALSDAQVDRKTNRFIRIYNRNRQNVLGENATRGWILPFRHCWASLAGSDLDGPKVLIVSAIRKSAMFMSEAA